MVKTITEEYVRACLPPRKMDAHKGDFGRVLLICGSVGFTGAAYMAAMAAARCGSGLVFVGVPECVYPIVATKLAEPMVFPLPSENGTLSRAAAAEVLARLDGMDAVLLGPGLGRSDGVFETVKALLSACRVPLVLDADGINVLQHHIDLLRESACPVIVTPHAGEFARLGGDLSLGREAAAEKLAKELGCVCLLKGHGTIVTDGEETYICPTGNVGMATGGSGDVLSGILASLVGQGIDPLTAAASSAWLHGRAGDLCAAEVGQYGMLPTDMIGVLPRLLP